MVAVAFQYVKDGAKNTGLHTTKDAIKLVDMAILVEKS